MLYDSRDLCGLGFVKAAWEGQGYVVLELITKRRSVGLCGKGRWGQSRVGVECDKRQSVDSLPEYFYPGSLE